MIKIQKKDREYLASIYNTDGKQKMYRLIREKYEVSNPSLVFASMKKATYLGYDVESDCFTNISSEINEADIFLDIESLCAKGSYRKSENLSERKFALQGHKSMDALIQELIGDRLLTLSKYVTLNAAEKVLCIDETTLKTDGYQVVRY